ncbi:MAG: Glutathione S-transferase domain [Rhodoferax sp.]|nr:Glutathione S-transferase domain [Rhodoferax sp.]
MLNLYTWTTPNGRKPLILLEELGVPYVAHAVNIGKNEQFTPQFLAISPNNKIPALVDDAAPGGALTIMESGAILTYLAEQSGRFLDASGPGRYKALEWLHWQIGGLGPMLGQLGFFAKRSEEKAPLAIKRFTEEAERLLGVMEKRLAAVPYLAGDDYTIADMASYAWTLTTTTVTKDVLAHTVANMPSVHRWLAAVGARPAVQRAMAWKPA